MNYSETLIVKANTCIAKLAYQKKMILLLFTICIVFDVEAQRPGSDYSFITVKDQLHNYLLVAGVSADNNVYHQKPDSRDVAQWQFVPTSDGYYHIVDRRHGLALVAGNIADNNVYHQQPNGPNAKWRLVPMGDNTFQIFDAKHNKALVAGDRQDNRVYHQNPGNRSNGIWKLEIVSGSGKAPKEMVVGEQYQSTKYHWDRVQYIGEPTKVIIEDSYTNNTNIQQSRTISKEDTKTVTETWSFSKEISKTVSNSIESSVNVGVKIKKVVNVGAQITHNHTSSKTEKEGTTKTKSQETTYTLKLSNKLDVEAGHKATCRNIVTEQKIDLPFTIITNRMFGDGRTEQVTVSGTWRGNQYSNSDIVCNSVPLYNTKPPSSFPNSTVPTHPVNQPVENNPPSTPERTYEEPYEDNYPTHQETTHGDDDEQTTLQSASKTDLEDIEALLNGDESYNDESAPWLIILEECSSNDFPDTNGYYYLTEDKIGECNCWNDENENFSIGAVNGYWVVFQGMDCPMNMSDYTMRIGKKTGCNPTEVECILLADEE